MGVAVNQPSHATEIAELLILVCARSVEPSAFTVPAAWKTRAGMLVYRFASYCRRTACVDSVFVCVPDVFDRSSAATWRLLPHFGTGRHGKRMQVQRRKKTPRGETAKAVPRKELQEDMAISNCSG